MGPLCPVSAIARMGPPPLLCRQRRRGPCSGVSCPAVSGLLVGCSTASAPTSAADEPVVSSFGVAVSLCGAERRARAAGDCSITLPGTCHDAERRSTVAGPHAALHLAIPRVSAGCRREKVSAQAEMLCGACRAPEPEPAQQVSEKKNPRVADTVPRWLYLAVVAAGYDHLATKCGTWKRGTEAQTRGNVSETESDP